MKKFLQISCIFIFCFMANTNAQQLEGPAEGKARVYLFNFGALIKTPAHVFVGNAYKGTVDGSRYIGFDVDPGKQLIWTFSAAKRWFSDAELEAGKTYYLHILMTPGKFNPVPAPVLYNACKNNKKGKKTYKSITKKLAANKFSPLDPSLQETNRDFSEITTVALEKWESEWKTDKQWKRAIIKSSDGF